MLKLGIKNATYIKEAIELTSASLTEELSIIPGIAGNETAHAMVIKAGQIAYAERFVTTTPYWYTSNANAIISYKYVYFTSIAFGAVSIVAALFLGDINSFMDDHVAVVMH